MKFVLSFRNLIIPHYHRFEGPQVHDLTLVGVFAHVTFL